MLAFPAHTTHLLQPLDVGIFMHIKKRFNQVCMNTGKVDSRSRVTKHYFPQTWQTSVKGATKSVIQSSFQRTGIYPFDPTAVDDSKIKKYQLVSIFLSLESKSLIMCNMFIHFGNIKIHNLRSIFKICK